MAWRPCVHCETQQSRTKCRSSETLRGAPTPQAWTAPAAVPMEGAANAMEAMVRGCHTPSSVKKRRPYPSTPIISSHHHKAGTGAICRQWQTRMR